MSEVSKVEGVTGRVLVTVQAADPISRFGVVGQLGRYPELEVVEDNGPGHGTVTVLLADTADQSTILQLRRLGGGVGVGVVLVVSALSGVDLLVAIELGVKVFLWRHEATEDPFWHRTA